LAVQQLNIPTESVYASVRDGLYYSDVSDAFDQARGGYFSEVAEYRPAAGTGYLPSIRPPIWNNGA